MDRLKMGRLDMDRLAKLVPAEDIGLRDVIALLRRRRLLVAICICISLLLGGLYLLFATPKYDAGAQLLIETSKLEVFGKGDVFEDPAITNGAIETQIQLLQSNLISESVVKRLRLISDPIFMGNMSNKGLKGLVRDQVARIIPYFKPIAASPVSEEQLTLRAVGTLRNNLSVSRIGLSYVVRVNYTSSDPKEAARIVNAFTDAYLENRVFSQTSAVGRATEWLQARLEELRERSYDSSIPADQRSAIRATYDSLLGRYTETAEQGSLPVRLAQVITPATPRGKSWPKPLLVMGGALAAGLLLGLGAALARDLADRSIRTRDQLESATGIPHLGALPTFRLGHRQKRTPAKQSGEQSGASSRKFSLTPSYSIAAGAPFSRFAETLRNIKVTADVHEAGPIVVVGVTSSIPNEGKTTVAANLAHLVAESGVRTLLVDGDLRSPTLSEDLVGEGSPGLVQVVTSDASISDVICHNQNEKLHFLPAGIQSRLLNCSEILSSNTARDLVGELRQSYDFVVVDLPPVLSVVDVRAAAHLFDGLLFVVEWERMTNEVIGQVLRHREIERRIIGTVFNKVNLSRLDRYEPQLSARKSGAYIDSYKHVA